jgi:Mn2+/Fe2+ NRAMP family transporter
VGPGAVLVGLAIGAGELIVWPITTARYGAGLAWAAMLGVALQLIINVEVGRYTLATGETSYAGFARLGRVWVPIFLMLNVLGWLLPAWARTCAGAVKALTVGADGPGEAWMWTALTFVFVAFVMFGPKNVYRTIERITLSLIALMLVGLVIIAVSVGTSDAAIELGRGIFNIGFKPPEMPAYEL